MPTPPFEHPLNLLMQTIATVVLWPLAVLVLIIAIRRSIREKTLFHVSLVLAVAFGSLLEPLYDISYHLLWFIPGQWTLFTSFDLPQPVWVMASYIVVFAGPALYLMPKLEERGITLKKLYQLAAFTALTTATFEIIAINSGLYMYYGEHPFRLLQYPLWIAVMEASQITCFAMACVWLHQRAGHQSLSNIALFILFPANFCFTTLGAGFPGVIIINTAEPSPLMLYIGALVSMVFAIIAIWMGSLSLPTTKNNRLTYPNNGRQ